MNIIKQIINFLLSMLNSKDLVVFLGAIEDDRTPEQIAYAYDNREVMALYSPEFKEKKDWKSYPVKRQYYTGQCVAQSTTKHLSINNIPETKDYVDLSAEFFYYFRSNKPGQGMAWLNAMKIAVEKGACYNFSIRQRFVETEPEFVPTEEMMTIASFYRGNSFVEDKVKSLDSIASIIDKYGSCLLWFWFDEEGKEWWKEYPSVIYKDLQTYGRGATRHAVIATDYGIRDGKKVIKIEDSAGNTTAINNQDRFIDEAFLGRCFIAGYVLDLKLSEDRNKYKFTGTRTLRVGMSGDDVRQLQVILKTLGLFPSNIDITGFYGGITRRAVIALQEKYADKILTPVGLTKGTGIVGQSTLKFLRDM